MSLLDSFGPAPALMTHGTSQAVARLAELKLERWFCGTLSSKVEDIALSRLSAMVVDSLLSELLLVV